ncbi:MAG: class I SAM-dependent methyltransferase, partial [Acidimicrobiales bacterium]
MPAPTRSRSVTSSDSIPSRGSGIDSSWGTHRSAVSRRCNSTTDSHSVCRSSAMSSTWCGSNAPAERRRGPTIYRRVMAEAPDPDLLKYYSFSVFTQLSGAVTAGMIHLGDRLGLYAALAGAEASLTTTELADRTGLDERWVREWAYNQAAAKLIAVDADVSPERFWLTPEATAVLATPDHPAFGMGMFHRFPQTMAALEVMPESFRTGMGHDYDSHGAEGAVGIERSFEPWNRHHLIPTVLPALEGIVERLQAGFAVADIGCGAGGAVLLMAEAFPKSTFVGYDISQHALERAEHRRREDNATNVRFVDPRVEPLPDDHSVDFVTTFACIHDMTHPQEMIDAIGAALAPMASIISCGWVMSWMQSK